MHRALNFRQDRRTGRHRSPRKTTFGRVLAGVDAQKPEQVLLRWQQRLTGSLQNPLVIVDGKTMRHGGVEMVNATNGLDVSMQEDLSRVRTPDSALVLGMIRRVVLSLSNAAVDKDRKNNPKTKSNTKNFRQRFLSARGGRERLQALIFAQNPAVLDLD